MDYIDTNVIIYWLTDHPNFGENATKIIRRIEAGSRAITSVLSLIQCHWILQAFTKNYSFESMISKIVPLRNLVIVPLTLNILVELPAVCKKYKLDFEDSVHYVTAIKNNCDTIYSNDPDFDKTGLKRKFE